MFAKADASHSRGVEFLLCTRSELNEGMGSVVLRGIFLFESTRSMAHGDLITRSVETMGILHILDPKQTSRATQLVDSSMKLRPLKCMGIL